MTAVQAAKQVLTVGPVVPDEMPRLAAWLAAEADERTVLRHLLEARHTDPIDVFRVDSLAEFHDRREAHMERLVDAGLVLLARFRVDADRLQQKLTAVAALAAEWRYKGEFGWGAWQEGQGPDQEGEVLDGAASAIRRVLGEDQP
jgi:hypothetical protein